MFSSRRERCDFTIVHMIFTCWTRSEFLCSSYAAVVVVDAREEKRTWVLLTKRKCSEWKRINISSTMSRSKSKLLVRHCFFGCDCTQKMCRLIDTRCRNMAQFIKCVRQQVYCVLSLRTRRSSLITQAKAEERGAHRSHFHSWRKNHARVSSLYFVYGERAGLDDEIDTVWKKD